MQVNDSFSNIQQEICHIYIFSTAMWKVLSFVVDNNSPAFIWGELSWNPESSYTSLAIHIWAYMRVTSVVHHSNIICGSDKRCVFYGFFSHHASDSGVAYCSCQLVETCVLYCQFILSHFTFFAMLNWHFVLLSCSLLLHTSFLWLSNISAYPFSTLTQSFTRKFYRQCLCMPYKNVHTKAEEVTKEIQKSAEKKHLIIQT